MVHALKRQVLVQGDEQIAAWVAKHARCVEVRHGSTFIKQGDRKHELFFILDGVVDVLINGRPVNSRHAGQHVGEMAIIMNSRRTATVVAREDCVLAKLTRDDFRRLSETFPVVWRGLAEELASRLHQRRNLIREPNQRPLLFLGSSSETKEVPERIRAALSDLNIEVRVWCDPGVFQASRTFIEDLTDAARIADFAVLAFGKEDVAISRRKRMHAPRDNVVFEAGLFIGAIGRERTLLIRPNNVD